jgi:hypothetical protein
MNKIFYFSLFMIIGLIFIGCNETKKEHSTVITGTFGFSNGADVFAFIKTTHVHKSLTNDIAFIDSTGNLEVITLTNENDTANKMSFMPWFATMANDSTGKPQYPSEEISIELPDTLEEGIYVVSGYAYSENVDRLNESVDQINFTEIYPNDQRKQKDASGFLHPCLWVRVKSGGKDLKELFSKPNLQYFYFGKAKVAVG